MNILMNTTVAREHGYYAGILYAYLSHLQNDSKAYGGFCKRYGAFWVRALSNAQIALELPCFPDSKTVKRAAAELFNAGLIAKETTGTFLEEKYLYGTIRDKKTWWHVVERNQAAKECAFDNEEAKAHGIPVALILACYRAVDDADEDGYRKLSPAVLAKVLPGKERAIARQLKSMVSDGLLCEHPTKAKFYRQPGHAQKATSLDRLAAAITERRAMKAARLIAQK